MNLERTELVILNYADKRISHLDSLDFLLSAIIHYDSIDPYQSSELIHSNRDILQINDTVVRSLSAEKLAYVHFFGLEDSVKSINLLEPKDTNVFDPMSKAFLLNSRNYEDLEEKIFIADEILDFLEDLNKRQKSHIDSLISCYLYYTITQHYIELRDETTARSLLKRLNEFLELTHKGGVFQRDLSNQIFKLAELNGKEFENILSYLKERTGSYWSEYLNEREYNNLVVAYIGIDKTRNICLEEFNELVPEPQGTRQHYLYHYCSAFVCNLNQQYECAIENYLRAKEYNSTSFSLDRNLAYIFLLLDESELSSKHFFKYFGKLGEGNQPESVIDVKPEHLYMSRVADSYVMIGNNYFRLFEKTGNESYLDTSIIIFDIISESMEEVILQAKIDLQADWRMYFNSWLSFGLNSAYEKYRLSPSKKNSVRFQNYLEKSKSNTRSSIQALRDCDKYGIPSDICQLEWKLFNSEIEKIDSRSFKILQQRDSLKLLIKEKHPKYYKRRYVYADNDWDELDRILKKENIKLIQFNWYISEHTGTSAIYSCFRNGDTFLVKRLENIDGMQSSVNDFSKLNTEVTGEISASGDSLYKWLIKPYENLIREEDKVVIIPDKEFYSVPFELLKADFERLDFTNSLLFTYNISYAYTCKSFIDQYHNRRSSEAEDSYLGFAYSGDIQTETMKFRRGIDELPYTLPEIRTVNKSLNREKSKIFHDKSCTIQNFLENVDDFSIIHLATHGLVNHDEPDENCLIFKNEDGPDSLYSNEIEKLNLTGKLVILSACETAVGQYSSPEGLLSLSNSFALAGVPTVISSTWALPDESTYQIMTSFAESFAETDEVALSLSLAKRKYLKNCKTREEKLPVNWAGLQCTGIPK